MKIRIGYVLKSMLKLKSPVGILKIHRTHTRARLCTPADTRTHTPTHGLNLINHMKLE